MMTQLAKLDALKEKLDSYRPLDKQVVNNLHQNLVLQWPYFAVVNEFGVIESGFSCHGYHGRTTPSLLRIIRQSALHWRLWGFYCTRCRQCRAEL